MKVNEKVKIKNIEFKNRIIMPPMATAKSDEKGHVTQEILDYYMEKTKNKLFSAVIIEHSYIDKKGRAHIGQTSISNDSDIEGMSKLAKIIKNNEALAILQITHAGSAAKREVIGDSPVGPSAILNPAREKTSEMPVELSIGEIEEIRDKFI